MFVRNRPDPRLNRLWRRLLVQLCNYTLPSGVVNLFLPTYAQTVFGIQYTMSSVFHTGDEYTFYVH